MLHQLPLGISVQPLLVVAIQRGLDGGGEGSPGELRAHSQVPSSAPSQQNLQKMPCSASSSALHCGRAVSLSHRGPPLLSLLDVPPTRPKKAPRTEGSVSSFSGASIQLDYSPSRRTRKVNLSRNHKGYNKSETTYEKLPARRVHISRTRFCIIHFDLFK